jgi:hypothetical protein
VHSDDDETIDVDDFLDELTEVFFAPGHSPVSEIQYAVPVVPHAKRPSLIILPDEGVSTGVRATLPASVERKRVRTRSIRLTPFAARAR